MVVGHCVAFVGHCRMVIGLWGFLRGRYGAVTGLLCGRYGVAVGHYGVVMGHCGSLWGSERAGLHAQWACPDVAPPLPAEKAPEEPPAKLLDDLFRKTKAAPCIYWLPLTDSQVGGTSGGRG